MSNSEQNNPYTASLRNDLREVIDGDVLIADAEWYFVASGERSDYLEIREKFEESAWFRAGLVDSGIMEVAPVLVGLSERGFPSEMLARLINSDETVIDPLALWLLGYLEEQSNREPSPHAVSNGELLKPADINFLTTFLLEFSTRSRQSPPCSLIYLVGNLLVGEKASHRAELRFRRFAFDVFSVAGARRAADEPVTARSVARALNCAPTTITRNRDKLKEYWDFETEGEGAPWVYIRALTDIHGKKWPDATGPYPKGFLVFPF